jgi:hypothetical protein
MSQPSRLFLPCEIICQIPYANFWQFLLITNGAEQFVPSGALPYQISRNAEQVE